MRPAIVANSLRIEKIGNTGGNDVTGASSEGDLVFMDVNNIGVNASLITVVYRKPGGTNLPCVNVRLSYVAAQGVVSCTTAASSGRGYQFQVRPCTHCGSFCSGFNCWLL